MSRSNSCYEYDDHNNQQKNYILDPATQRLLDLTASLTSKKPLLHTSNCKSFIDNNNDGRNKQQQNKLKAQQQQQQQQHVEKIISILNDKAPKLLEGLCKQKQRNVASRVQVRCYARDEVVFRQDDEPDAFYTVIRGAVSIYAQNSTASSESSSCPTTAAVHALSISGQQQQVIRAEEDDRCSVCNNNTLDDADSDDSIIGGEKESQQQQAQAKQRKQRQQQSSIDEHECVDKRSQMYGKFLVQLAPGFGFGELSFNVDGNHSKRSAGVVSDGSHGQSKIVIDGSNKEYEASNVAVLLLVPGETYLKEMFGRDIGKHQTKEKVDFLKSSFLFSMWSVDQLVEMSYGMKKQEFSPGSLLVREGERAENILIIKKGQIRVSIDTKKDIKSANGDTLVEVAMLGESDLFGIVEAFQNIKKMKRSATALTAVEVFAIQSPIFISFLFQVPRTHAMLAKVVKKRTMWEKLRVDYASKFPTMKLSLPANFQKRLSEYQLSRGMVLTEREIKFRKARSFDLYRCMRNARSTYRVYVNETKGGSRKKAEEALKESSNFCRQAIVIAEEIEDGKRRKQANDLLIKVKGGGGIASTDSNAGKSIPTFVRDSKPVRGTGIEKNRDENTLVSGEGGEFDDDEDEDELTPANRDQKILLLYAKAGLQISTT